MFTSKINIAELYPSVTNLQGLFPQSLPYLNVDSSKGKEKQRGAYIYLDFMRETCSAVNSCLSTDDESLIKFRNIFRHRSGITYPCGYGVTGRLK